MKQRNYYVYVMASQRNGTLYIGVTNDIERRVAEHRQGAVEGFTKEYHVDRLVYFEYFPDIEDAIRREKQLKKWNRAWKIELIQKRNPEWIDLSTVNYQFPYSETKPLGKTENAMLGEDSGFPLSRE